MEEFEALVTELMATENYRRIALASRELDHLWESIGTARKTKHPSYVRVATESLRKFKVDWLT